MSFQTFSPLVVYPANGETTVFPIPDKFYDAGDIKVFSIIDGLEESITSGFSVQITQTDPIPPKMNRGNVVFEVAPATGDIALLIWPDSDQDQPFEGRPVTPKQRERVHDRHSMRDAVLRQFFFRGYRSPLNAEPGLRFIAAGEPGRVPTWDELGNLIEGPTVNEVALVADIAEEITIVAGISAQVQAVAAIDTEISGVYAIRVAVSGVYGIRNAIITLAPIDDEIVALAPVADDIAALGPHAAQIGQLAPISAQISAVAAIDDEIVAVYAKLADIEAVADELPVIASKMNADGSNATGRLGATAQVITDWNDATENGWYGGAGVANAPVAGDVLFVGIVERWSASFITQTVHHINQDSPDDTRTYRRSRDSGVWGPWYRLRISEAEQSANYVGTVSQSGGVPTGAVIQRGSNGNGTWIRFADGTQICHNTASSGTSSDSTWTYPASFFSAPDSVQISPKTGLTGGAMAMIASGPTASSCQFSGWSAANSRINMTVSLMAIGRWYN